MGIFVYVHSFFFFFLLFFLFIYFLYHLLPTFLRSLISNYFPKIYDEKSLQTIHQSYIKCGFQKDAFF